MPRPLKEGADYFPHDVNAFDDGRILYLEGIFGMLTYNHYWKLLELMGKSAGFKQKWNELLIPGIARRIGCNHKELLCFVDEAIKIQAFVLEDGYLFSPDLINSLSSVLKRRKGLYSPHPPELKDSESEKSNVSDLIDYFQTTYFETRGREYEVISRTSEISYLTKLCQITDDTAWYILEALLITDKWYFENMSIKLLYTHYNQIISIIENAKQTTTNN